MVSSSLCPHCSSSASEFWNLSAAHHRSHFLLHPAAQHPLEQTRQRYTQQLLNQPLLFLAYLFVAVLPWHPFFFSHQVAGTLTPILTFQSLHPEVQTSHPSVPSLLPHLLPLPPSSCSPPHFPLCCSSPHQSAVLRSDRDAGLWWRLPDCQHISIHRNTHMHTLNKQEPAGNGGSERQSRTILPF